MEKKSFSGKVNPDTPEAVEQIKTEEGTVTFAETIDKIIEIYWKYKKTLVEYGKFQKDFHGFSESFPSLPEVFQKFSEVYQKISEENQKLTAENLEKTEALKIQPDYAAKISEKDLEISRLTEQYSEVYRKFTEEIQRKTAKRPVDPKWAAIAEAYAERNQMDVEDMLWMLFASFTKYNNYHGIKHPKSDVINEIKERFNT